MTGHPIAGTGKHGLRLRLPARSANWSAAATAVRCSALAGLMVGQWMETWLTTIAPRRIRRSTLESTYAPKVRNRIIPGLGKHRLDRLTPEHIERFYTRLEAEGLAPATVLQIHRILSRALKVAMQRGYVARNVATLVDAPSASQDEIEPLEPR